MEPFRIGTTYEAGVATLKSCITRLRDTLDVDGDHVDEDQFPWAQYAWAYTSVYYFCTKEEPRYAEELLDLYNETLASYIFAEVSPSLINLNGEIKWRALIARWEDYKLFSGWLSVWFSFLEIDRHSHLLRKLNEVALYVFKLMVYDVVEKEFRVAIISMINQEYVHIDRDLLKNMLHFSVDVGNESMRLYLVDETIAYFSKIGFEWMQAYSWQEHMLEIGKCLKTEKNRVSPYFNVDEMNELFQIVGEELFLTYGFELLEQEDSGFHALMRNKNVPVLLRAFNLFHEVPGGLVPLVHLFKQHITSELRALFELSNEQEVLVNQVMELHEKSLSYVASYFVDHQLFHKALVDSFHENTKKDISCGSFAPILATVCDSVLKDRSMSHAQIDSFFEKVAYLIRIIGDSTSFFKKYRNDLAGRLLANKWANNDLERRMLTKFHWTKSLCHINCCSILDRMVDDMTLAKKNKALFNEFVKAGPYEKTQIDLTVAVLNSRAWPNKKYGRLKLPAEMEECEDTFKKFYATTSKNKNLTWIYSLGTCAIDVQFENKKIELVVSTMQAAVLMLFNDSNRLSFEKMRKQLKLKTHVLMSILDSLSVAKYRILKKVPDTESISPADFFEFNVKFTDESNSIKMPVPIPKRKMEVTKELYLTLMCRIMKSSGELVRSELVKLFRQRLEFLNVPFDPVEFGKSLSFAVDNEVIEIVEGGSACRYIN